MLPVCLSPQREDREVDKLIGEESQDSVIPPVQKIAGVRGD